MTEEQQSKLEQFLQIMDADAEVCTAMRDLFLYCKKRHEDINAVSRYQYEKDDALSLYMSYGFNYLSEKFRCFWFDEEELEMIVRRNRPHYDLFSPDDFEMLTRFLLYLIEGRNYQMTQGSHDKGIDLAYEKKLDFVGGSGVFRNVVQCKLYRGSVSVVDIRDFFGVLTARVAEGYFFTTGQLTNAGLQFINMANQSSYANKFYFVGKKQFIQLLDMGSAIVQLWDDYRKVADVDALEDEAVASLINIEMAQKQAIAIIRAPVQATAQLTLFP